MKDPDKIQTIDRAGARVITETGLVYNVGHSWLETHQPKRGDFIVNYEDGITCYTPQKGGRRS